MGQQESHLPSSAKESMLVGEHNEQFESDSLLEAPSNSTRGIFCMNLLCPPRQEEIQEWEVFLRRRLENLKRDEWASLLLKTLRDTNHANLDRTYQAEVIRVEAQGYLDDNKKFRGTEIELKDHKIAKTEPTTVISSQKLQSESQINPDEETMEMSKMLYQNEEASWVRDSFDIRAKEDRQSVIESYNYLKEIRDSTTTLENANSSQEKANLQNRLSSYRQQYDNYTILVPNTIESLKDSNAQKASMEENMTKYKLIFSVIEKHLKKPENIFKKLLIQFEQWFISQYRPILDMYQKKELTSKQMKQYVTNGTTDLQHFIGVLYESITLYYRLDKIKKESADGSRNILNRDNVMNFVTSMVLNEKVYNTIFDLYCTQDTEVEAIYKKNVNHCSGYGPEDFGISDEYCLNDKTLAYLRKEGRIKKPNTEENSEEQPAFKKTVEESKRRYSKSGIPYERAIVVLSDLKNRRSPIHKLKNIVRVAELISKSIDKFYKIHGTKNRKRLDADQTLSVFIYLVARSGLTNVSAHYTIIEKFTTSNVLNSTAGYYATTLGACVACISSMDFLTNSTIQEPDDDIKKFLRSSKIGGVSANSSITHSGKF